MLHREARRCSSGHEENGEKGLFELVQLAKKQGWQIYDSGLSAMIDLNNPKKNGYENFKKYVNHIVKNKNNP